MSAPQHGVRPIDCGWAMPEGPRSRASHRALLRGLGLSASIAIARRSGMTAALLFGGIACLLIGWLFFWLNLNSPIQTRIPFFTLPLGFAAVLLGLGRLIA